MVIGFTLLILCIAVVHSHYISPRSVEKLNNKIPGAIVGIGEVLVILYVVLHFLHIHIPLIAFVYLAAALSAGIVYSALVIVSRGEKD